MKNNAESYLDGKLMVSISLQGDAYVTNMTLSKSHESIELKERRLTCADFDWLMRRFDYQSRYSIPPREALQIFITPENDYFVGAVSLKKGDATKVKRARNLRPATYGAIVARLHAAN